MEESLMARCARFVENRDAIKSAFKFEYAMMHCLCALLYGNKKADVQKIRDCKKLIKSETSLFSFFRGNAFLAMATMLALEDDPGGRFAQVKQTYSILKAKKFWGSDFLALAAFLIREADARKEEELIDKARHIYTLVRAAHPLLTSSDDYGYATMLALSGRTAQDAASETERCYEILKSGFFSKNAVQGLCFVLAMGEGSAADKCGRAQRIYGGLKEKGYRFGTGYELPTLGVLALVPDGGGNIVTDVIEACDYLKSQKGFGTIGVGRSQRVMFASALAAQNRTDDAGGAIGVAVTTTVANIMIAIEIAIIAAVSASSAAAASSSSGN